MKKRFLFLFVCVFSLSLYSQSPNTAPKRGTIKVRKTGQLEKVVYDDVNYRLIGIDRFGNVLDSAVVEFQMSVSVNGVFYTEKGIGPVLTYQMQQLLGRCDSSTTLFFKNIKAKDKNGTLIDIPKFQYNFIHSEN